MYSYVRMNFVPYCRNLGAFDKPIMCAFYRNKVFHDIAHFSYISQSLGTIKPYFLSNEKGGTSWTTVNDRRLPQTLITSSNHYGMYEAKYNVRCELSYVFRALTFCDCLTRLDTSWVFQGRSRSGLRGQLLETSKLSWALAYILHLQFFEISFLLFVFFVQISWIVMKFIRLHSFQCEVHVWNFCQSLKEAAIFLRQTLLNTQCNKKVANVASVLFVETVCVNLFLRKSRGNIQHH